MDKAVILAAGRGQGTAPSSVGVNQTVAQVTRMLQGALGERIELAHEDLRREVAADAREIPLGSLTRRARLLEEIAAAAQSNVTIPYAVASAQHRMGLDPGDRS